jgi:O-antigen ligase
MLIQFSKNFYLAAFAIINLFATVFIALGILPQDVVFVVLVLQIAAVLWFDLEYGLYSFILSLPFYLVLPHLPFDSFSVWRIVSLVLFAKFYYLNKEQANRVVFNSWDKALVSLFFILLISSLFGSEAVLGIKKLIFLGNAYLIYLLASVVIKSSEQIVRSIKVIFVSLFSVVLLGYVQFFATFFSSAYYFWQYWAIVIAKSFYGLSLSKTLQYSNSWFIFESNQPTGLRMFSVLPDSHSFAVMAMFVIPFAHALLKIWNRTYQKILIWLCIALSLLAIVLSGTRGVWAGSLIAMILVGYLFVMRYGRKIFTAPILTLVLFVVLILSAPVLQLGINKIKSGVSGNALQRAESIYDLNESSNQGRLYIWKHTIKNIVVKEPFLGVGFGNFGSSLNSEDEKAFNLPKEYISAHNFYLEILTEAGLIGLLGLLWCVKAIAEAFWKFLKQFYLFSDDSLVIFTVSSGLIIAWLFAYLFFDTTIFNDRVLIFTFLILALSGAIIRIKKAHS